MLSLKLFRRPSSISVRRLLSTSESTFSHSSSSRRGVWGKRVAGFTAVLVGGGCMGAGALYLSDRPKYETMVRISRCLFVAAAMLLDYSWVLKVGAGTDSKAFEDAHERNAKKLRDLFFKNKGIYIKLGQYIGMMDHIVPDAYVKTLSECFDQAPKSSFEDVEAVLKEEFGKSSSELFRSFEQKPIASASLAQVHVAYTFSGEKLAVKVQHRHLSQVPKEIHALDFILRCVRYLQPDFGFKQIIEEAKVNIPNELDFNLEARNSNLCREIVRPFGSAVVVPRIHPEFVSRRVLGMQFEEGKHLCDAGALEALKINRHTVVKLLTEVFCHMTFRHGIVHCDPHPANVLMRRAGDSGEIQLVLLDHGLYRFVSPKTRLVYSRLWKGIVLGDVKEVEQASTDLGLVSPWMEKKHPGMTHTLIAAMLTGQDWTTIASEGGLGRVDGNEQEAKKNLAKNVQEYFEGIKDILDSCPRDLLLLLKTSDALRCCSNRLGGRTSDIFAITAKSCIAALLDEDIPSTSTSTIAVGAPNTNQKVWWTLDNFGYRLSLIQAYVRVVLFMWWQDWAPRSMKLS